MPSDVLSDALAFAHASCTIAGCFTAGGDWSVSFEGSAALKLNAIASGSCWLTVGGREPELLIAGDVIVMNEVNQFVLCSDPALTPAPASALMGHRFADGTAVVGDGAEVAVFGGHVEMNAHGRDLLLTVLPRITVVRGAGADVTGLQAILAALLAEATAAKPGVGHAIAGYAQVLFVYVLRLMLSQEADSAPGWLSALTDPALRPAVARMHEAPAYPWSLAELAAAAAMSRSSFSSRFRQAAGMPPLTYLNRWRLRLAEAALTETDVTVASLAESLGYASESSFSHAFQRVLGVSPGRYRRAAHMNKPSP